MPQPSTFLKPPADLLHCAPAPTSPQPSHLLGVAEGHPQVCNGKARQRQRVGQPLQVPKHLQLYLPNRHRHPA